MESGVKYKEISIAVRAKDSIIRFQELHDKLTDYESYLKREESRNSASITANTTRFSQPKYGNQGKKHNPSYSNNQSSNLGQRQTTLWNNTTTNAGSNKGPHPHAMSYANFVTKRATPLVCAGLQNESWANLQPI